MWELHSIYLLPWLIYLYLFILYFVDERRDLEAEIVSIDNIYIDCTSEHSTKPPKSITLLKSVQTSAYTDAVLHYKGVTYLGTNNYTVETIDSDFNIKTLVSLGEDKLPRGISIHDERIYVLVSGVEGPYTINVYDLSGQLITQWDRTDSCFSTRLSIVSNQIVVPDYENKQLTVYSLTGEVIKCISCPLISGDEDSQASTCVVDNNSIIVTHCDTSQVFKVNISTEETVWTCNDVAEPLSVATYGKDYVCVGSEGKISLLNINTG